MAEAAANVRPTAGSCWTQERQDAALHVAKSMDSNFDALRLSELLDAFTLHSLVSVPISRIRVDEIPLRPLNKARESMLRNSFLTSCTASIERPVILVQLGDEFCCLDGRIRLKISTAGAWDFCRVLHGSLPRTLWTRVSVMLNVDHLGVRCPLNLPGLLKLVVSTMETVAGQDVTDASFSARGRPSKDSTRMVTILKPLIGCAFQTSKTSNSLKNHVELACGVPANAVAELYRLDQALETDHTFPVTITALWEENWPLQALCNMKTEHARLAVVDVFKTIYELGCLADKSKQKITKAELVDMSHKHLLRQAVIKELYCTSVDPTTNTLPETSKNARADILAGHYDEELMMRAGTHKGYVLAVAIKNFCEELAGRAATAEGTAPQCAFLDCAASTAVPGGKIRCPECNRSCHAQCSLRAVDGGSFPAPSYALAGACGVRFCLRSPLAPRLLVKGTDDASRVLARVLETCQKTKEEYLAVMATMKDVRTISDLLAHATSWSDDFEGCVQIALRKALFLDVNLSTPEGRAAMQFLGFELPGSVLMDLMSVQIDTLWQAVTDTRWRARVTAATLTVLDGMARMSDLRGKPPAPASFPQQLPAYDGTVDGDNSDGASEDMSERGSGTIEGHQPRPQKPMRASAAGSSRHALSKDRSMPFSDPKSDGESPVGGERVLCDTRAWAAHDDSDWQFRIREHLAVCALGAPEAEVFLVEAQWMSRWEAYVRCGITHPGPINNDLLLDGSSLKAGLHEGIDFIKVTRSQWDKLKESYTGGPLIVRRAAVTCIGEGAAGTLHTRASNAAVASMEPSKYSNACAVCMEAFGEELVNTLCERCHVRVHADCPLPGWTFQCGMCHDRMVCRFCCRRDGALFCRTMRPGMCHVLCALWHGQGKRVPAQNIGVLADRSACCMHCTSRSGSVILCAAPACTGSFHVLCGLHHSASLRLELRSPDTARLLSQGSDDQRGRDTFAVVGYCAQHSDHDLWKSMDPSVREFEWLRGREALRAMAQGCSLVCEKEPAMSLAAVHPSDPVSLHIMTAMMTQPPHGALVLPGGYELALALMSQWSQWGLHHAALRVVSPEANAADAERNLWHKIESNNGMLGYQFLRATSYMEECGFLCGAEPWKSRSGWTYEATVFPRTWVFASVGDLAALKNIASDGLAARGVVVLCDFQSYEPLRRTMTETGVKVIDCGGLSSLQRHEGVVQVQLRYSAYALWDIPLLYHSLEESGLMKLDDAALVISLDEEARKGLSNRDLEAKLSARKYRVFEQTWEEGLFKQSKGAAYSWDEVQEQWRTLSGSKDSTDNPFTGEPEGKSSYAICVDPSPPPSLFEEPCPGNLMHVRFSPHDRLNRTSVSEGNHTPYLFLGPPERISVFPFHQEECNICSVNYVHRGADKWWYFVLPSHAKRMNNLFHKLHPEIFDSCMAAPRHKVFATALADLEENGIRVIAVRQVPGTFVITRPGAYHAGFNAGENIAEAVNFVPLGSFADKQMRNCGPWCQCSEKRWGSKSIVDAILSDHVSAPPSERSEKETEQRQHSVPRASIFDSDEADEDQLSARRVTRIQKVPPVDVGRSQPKAIGDISVYDFHETDQATVAVDILREATVPVQDGAFVVVTSSQVVQNAAHDASSISGSALVRVGNVDLVPSDLKRLAAHADEDPVAAWLNDTLMDAYIEARIKPRVAILGLQIGVLSCVFSLTLATRDTRRREDKAAKLLTDGGIFDKEHVIFPLACENHWMLVVISNHGKNWTVLESLHTELSQARKERIAIAMNVVKRLWLESHSEPMGIDDPDVRQVGRQENSYQCGPYVLEFMERFISAVAAHQSINTVWVSSDQARDRREELKRLTGDGSSCKRAREEGENVQEGTERPKKRAKDIPGAGTSEASDEHLFAGGTSVNDWTVEPRKYQTRLATRRVNDMGHNAAEDRIATKKGRKRKRQDDNTEKPAMKRPRMSRKHERIYAMLGPPEPVPEMPAVKPAPIEEEPSDEGDEWWLEPAPRWSTRPWVTGQDCKTLVETHMQDLRLIWTGLEGKTPLHKLPLKCAMGTVCERRYEWHVGGGRLRAFDVPRLYAQRGDLRPMGGVDPPLVLHWTPEKHAWGPQQFRASVVAVLAVAHRPKNSLSRLARELVCEIIAAVWKSIVNYDEVYDINREVAEVFQTDMFSDWQDLACQQVLAFFMYERIMEKQYGAEYDALMYERWEDALV